MSAEPSLDAKNPIAFQTNIFYSNMHGPRAVKILLPMPALPGAMTFGRHVCHSGMKQCQHDLPD